VSRADRPAASGALVPTSPWRHLAALPVVLGCRRSPEAVAAWRDRRVRQLVAHAYERVPYYRRLLDGAGVRPGDVRGVADLARVPITTKDDLRTLDPAETVARGTDPRRLITLVTSGSSGEPFVVRRAWAEERMLGLVWRRALRVYGVRRTDRVAVLQQYDHPDPRDSALPQRLARSLGRGRALLLGCHLPADELLARLEAFRPDVIGGYPGVLARVADAAAARGAATLAPRAVIAGGEVLTPLMARRIADGFGAPVHDAYGCYELGRIAWRCPTGDAYHVFDEGVVAEVVRDGTPVAPGERGELVGTALHSFAMPLIRYRLGDSVVRGDGCACGRPVSTLGGIQGRMVDFFTLPHGRVLHPYEISAAAPPEAMRWVRQFQLVQERADRVVLRAVPFVPPTDEQLAAVAAAATRVLGPGVAFAVELRDDLALEQGGKFRVYRSLVSSEYDPPEAPAPTTGDDS
jgi:phenylacetate-CoA ligase